MSIRRLLLLILVTGLLGAPPVQAQSGDQYDASWYEAGAPYVQIDVTADGVYRLDASTLESALPDGTSLADLPPESIRLFEKGREIPIQLSGTADGQLDPSDTITFVGQRNRGTDELWAYNGEASAQSSTYHSLYADTTTYWMTWGGPEGRRYQKQSPAGGAASTTSLRDTLRLEQDKHYYFGRPNKNGDALYTESEGYFWRRFSHNDTAPISDTYTLPVDRRVDAEADTLDLRVRLDAATASCHRVGVEARLGASGSASFETVGSVEWRNFSFNGTPRPTVTAQISQARIPEGGLDLRLTSYNSGFSLNNCTPSETPNYVLLDWIEAVYTRTLEAQNDRQRFVAQAEDETTYALSGHSGSPVHVYNPNDSVRFETTISGGTASVTGNPSSAPTAYWAVGPNGFREPAAVRPDAPSNWSASDNKADDLILTTKALQSAARTLAEYRRSEAGGNYDVEIALVQNVFDEFDYGRPTPLAIRRLVRASQDWAVAPQFLTIFGDAQYPIDDGSIDSRYPEWSVPSFGYSPSDGWFAMQSDGPNDWSESLAVGRIPVRSVAQGERFVEKLKTYEQAPLKRWQKRMLLLAGGTNRNEQESLQSYSNRWGEIASDTVANTPSYSGPVSTGMDTLRYYKNVDDALDASFQDSLAADLRKGAGWLNYFGHSGAQTWEIVTDPPSDFDNAGKLPVVVSLGCRTGSFAGGRFEEKDAPSLGEQLVVGSVRPDGTPREGTLNGGIAHFGESALGNRLPSARLNDAFIRRVFVDTSRVLGEAIRTAKAEVAASYGSSDFYVKHLLQYGLLGDPATQLALPEQPDFHVAPNRVSISPPTPTPSDELTVAVDVQNRGLIPSDSVTVRLTWERPDGTITRRTRRVDRFPLSQTLAFSFSPTDRALGVNTFQVTVDPNGDYTEENDANNTTQKTKTVFSTGLSLLSPTDFETVASARPSLRFFVSRETTDPVPVTVQLDSVPSFSSSFLQETQLAVDDLTGAWTPDNLPPNATYYWRARPSDGTESWTRAGFTVAPSLDRGTWLQENRLFSPNTNDQLTRSQRSWQFEAFSRNVSIMSGRGSGSRTNGFVIDGASSYVYLGLGFGVLVMNDLTGQVRASHSFATYDVKDRFDDAVEKEQQAAIDSLRTFLNEVPQEGDYVFVRTRHLARGSGPSIPSEVKEIFRNLGSTSSVSAPYSEAIDTLTYDHLWNLKARKGVPEETVERVSPPSEASEVNEIIDDVRLSFRRASGRTVTPRIGPASDWDTLSWTAQTDPEDDLRVDVLAADSTVLIDDLSGSNGKKALDAIDASIHPYLRLRASLSDTTNRTAPQLNRWSVSYRGVPELAVDRRLFSFPDSLRQGARDTASVPVANLGPVPSDSVHLQFTIEKASGAVDTVAAAPLPPLPPDTRRTKSVEISTANRPGQNVLTATSSTNGPPERLKSNNSAVRSFFVDRDETPPDVTVLADDREIPPTPSGLNDRLDKNLPFVSSDPSLDIVLEDDNPNLSLDDTSHVDVFLKGSLPRDGTAGTGQSDFRRIPFTDDVLTLAPSDTESPNTLRVRYTPSLPPEDSLYTLKVEGRDAEGNEVEPYEGSFRTKSDQVIRDVYPYPNPMSSHTTFAFRIEGGRNEMLHDFALRIYTLSGRLVRTFDEADLETPLGVGWNTLRWNGRDEDGDRVATGVYLYRVRVKGDDQTFRGNVEKVTVIR